MMLRGLPPIVDRSARILILGSFPSQASLQAQQYYAHPRNQFWRILGAVIDAPLFELPYPERIAHVQAAGLAIWDSYAACEREGSLDAAIGDTRPTDIVGLRKSALALRRVCFNGRSAARREQEMVALGLATRVLPSTSPAHAGMSFDDKLARWRAALFE